MGCMYRHTCLFSAWDEARDKPAGAGLLSSLYSYGHSRRSTMDAKKKKKSKRYTKRVIEKPEPEPDAMIISNYSEVAVREDFEAVDAEILSKHSEQFRKLAEGGINKFRTEFKTLKGYMPPGTKDAFLSNNPRNRYEELWMIDSNRVKLADKSDGDFIHASRIEVGPNVTYIATQGPMPNTLENFWNMIHQEKAAVIVMLCRFKEDGKEKCSEYFPQAVNSQESYGSYSVKCAAVDSKDGIVITSLELQKAKTGKTFKIDHLKFDGWPDHLTPENVDQFQILMKLARKKRTAAPTIVHCSAGVGRTGCFIAIEISRYMMIKEDKFKLEDLLKTVRNGRAHAIQNDLQFLFVARMILDNLVERNVGTKKSIAKFLREYEDCQKRRKGRVQKVNGTVEEIDKDKD